VIVLAAPNVEELIGGRATPLLLAADLLHLLRIEFYCRGQLLPHIQGVQVGTKLGTLGTLADQPKITDLGLEALIQQDVGRLDVSMDKGSASRRVQEVNSSVGIRIKV